jgi:hypothetical protein
MYLILLEMAEKYNRLEQKIEEMNKFITTERKRNKINILQWLNNPDTNNKPEFLFDDLINKINVEYSDIEYLFNHSILETINQIFTHSLYTFASSNTSHKEILPLQMFNQKSNSIYIYNKMIQPDSNNEEIVCWHDLSRKSFLRFLNILHSKIIKMMNEWRKKNKDLVNESDSCAIIYDKAFLKLMNIDFKCDSTLNKIKSMIYGNMKTDITNLIEYEIQF